MEKKFDLDDIVIIPAVVSEIRSRSQCRVANDDLWLPLIASPMDTVVCKENINIYISNHIIPCSPRGNYYNVDLVNRNMVFQSFGLDEIEVQLNSEEVGTNDFYKYPYVLIDIANGHIEALVGVVKEIKSKFPHIQLMVGNIANPLTYKNLAMAGADFVRCSIGTGASCTTSANVAINYPMGSLIHECRKEKIKGGFWNCKIVADGALEIMQILLKH
jgi:hypothetical protein